MTVDLSEGHVRWADQENVRSREAELQNLREQLAKAHQALQDHASESKKLRHELEMASSRSIEDPVLNLMPSPASTDGDRSALRLQRAEHALETERAMCAKLRRQLEALKHNAGESQRVDTNRDILSQGIQEVEGASTSDPRPIISAASGMMESNGSSSEPSSTIFKMDINGLESIKQLTDLEQLQQELAVAQTQLLQRTVEAERLRRHASEREGEAQRLRKQVEVLNTGGRMTLEAEQELIQRIDDLSKVNIRLRSEVSQLRTLEQNWVIKLRAAEDRAGVAERISLDIQRQCEAAAATITRLIDENSELAYKVNVQGTSVSSLKVELRKKDATITALEQLMASWQGGGRWGSRANAAGVQETGRRGDGHDGTDGARTPDQLIDFRAELAAAVDAAFLAQSALRSSSRRRRGNAGLANGDDDDDDDDLEDAGHRRHRRHGSLSFSGGGIATPLGGIPEAEWKLRALEEELERMEAELREERASRMQLELRVQESSSAIVTDGSPSQPQRPLHLSDRLSVVDELRSVVASAASRSGLPISLRIQALAQNLAMLDEDIEREKALQEELRHLVKQRANESSVVNLGPEAAHAFINNPPRRWTADGIGAVPYQGVPSEGVPSSQDDVVSIPHSLQAPLQSLPHHVLAAPPHVVNVFERRDPRPLDPGTADRQGVEEDPSSAPEHLSSSVSSQTAQHPSAVVTPFSHINDHLHHHHDHHHHHRHTALQSNQCDQTRSSNSQQPPALPLPISTSATAASSEPKIPPAKGLKLVPLRTEGSDFDLSLEAESSYRSKRGGLGFWGWLTGADASSNNNVL